MAKSAVSAPKVDKKNEIAKQHGNTRIPDSKILEILHHMENGLSENKACQIVNVPRSTFRMRVARFNAENDANYARSLATLAETKIEAIDSAVDMLLRGEIDPMTARVVIDTYKWQAARLLPKKYGDKLDLTSDGKALPTPLLGSITTEDKKDA